MTGPQVERIGRGPGPLTILVDGDPVSCAAGETLACAILAARDWIASDGLRRYSVFCGIGSCFECVVVVDGIPGIRACLTPVADGLRLVTDGGRADGA